MCVEMGAARGHVPGRARLTPQRLQRPVPPLRPVRNRTRTAAAATTQAITQAAHAHEAHYTSRTCTRRPLKRHWHLIIEPFGAAAGAGVGAGGAGTSARTTRGTRRCTRWGPTQGCPHRKTHTPFTPSSSRAYTPDLRVSLLSMGVFAPGTGGWHQGCVGRMLASAAHGVNTNTVGTRGAGRM